MSASARKKIAAAQRARWANLRRATPSTRSVKRAAKAKKKTMSPAARKKVSAKLKAYWAQKKFADNNLATSVQRCGEDRIATAQ